MDVNMPIMDGFTATRTIKAKVNSSPELSRYYKIIIVTAFSDPKDQELAHQSGADYFMTKPVNKLKLVAILEKLAIKL